MSQSQNETDLIRQVVANPDDDAPRLAYADWLAEHGCNARARFIRVQCQVERLLIEEREILKRNGKEWGQPLLDLGVDHWKFHRGFPEEVRLRIQDYLNKHAQLNDITPLSHLHLIGGSDESLRKLAISPAARQIRSLEIDFPHKLPDPTDFGINGLRALAASNDLGGLNHLTLHSHYIGEDGIKAIANSPTFRNLTHLTLTDPTLTDPINDSIPRLANAPNLSALTSLRLGDADFGTRALQLMRSIKQTFRKGR